MIRLTPSQLRDALDLSKETFRYWKKEFPMLASKQGSRARYGPVELLSTAIIKQLAELGLPVGRIKSFAPSIHQQCKSGGWLSLERQVLAVQLESNEVLLSTTRHSSYAESTLFVPLAPIIARLRAHLLQDDDSVDQRNLTFGPMSVSRGAHS